MVSRLKEYEILCKIGQGSFGTVFKVKRKIDRAILVIKLIKITTLSKKNQQDSLHEVNILSSLNCPYIVKYYDSFVENSTLYIVMEYCEKGDLSQILKKQQLQEQKIWKFFIQISIGLEYLHSKQILHRDIKSLNIFLSNDDSIRIGDLGVAKILNNTHAFAQTQVGSPYYLSPELCEEKPYNTKSDVWALGCVLYEMCTTKHPFQAPTQAALLLKIIKGSYQPLSSEYSAGLREIIDLCLEKDFKKRPSISVLLQKPEIQKIVNTISLIIPTSSVLHKSMPISPGINEHTPINECKIKLNNTPSYKASKLVEEVQKQLSDNRKNLQSQGFDEKMRPMSANRPDVYGVNKKSLNVFLNDIHLKNEKSPPRLRNIIISKPLNVLLKNNIHKDYGEEIVHAGGILERKSEKDIPHLKKKSFGDYEEKFSHNQNHSSNNIKINSPLKKYPVQIREIIEMKKIESKREYFSENKIKAQEKWKIDRPGFVLNNQNNKNIPGGSQEEIKKIFRSNNPLSAKAQKIDRSIEDIKLVKDLPEIPKTKQKETEKYIQEYIPVKIINAFNGKKYFKVLKKPLIEPYTKFNANISSLNHLNRLEKNNTEKKNHSLDEIILDPKETGYVNNLRQKEREYLKNNEELLKKCSDLRKDIIKMIGVEIFNEMHNMFTSIITVKNK